MVVLTKRIDDMTKGKSKKRKKEKEKSEKGLLAKSFDWDHKSISLDDEGSTKIREFIAIVKDEPSVGKAGARSGQWVDITMKKTYSKVTLDQLLSEQVHGSIVKALGRKGRRKEKISSKEAVFTKDNESSPMLAPEITSDLESECDFQEPLLPRPKLIGATPSSTSENLISLSDLTLNMADLTLETTVPKKTRPSVKMSPAHVVKKRTEKSHVIPKPYPDKRIDSSTEQLIFTLIKEVNGLKRQIEIPTSTPSCNFQPSRVAYVNGLKHNLISISQLCDANYKVLFSKTQGTIYNQNDEVVLIAPKRRDVYIIDMSSFNKESNACFFANASLSVNWLWHKRLSHLNFKNIINLAKHNLVSGLHSLNFSKDEICSAYEKGKHHRASFKTKRSFSINKSLHLLHMDLFGPVKP
nr:retrovirus-related Pol polyprotein from transposon TNT 1-94 [Tanacetum cinerariifolium]